MFDANMRHLPKGRKFFAKVYSTGGAFPHRDKMFLCEMMTKEHENPTVDFGGLLVSSEGSGDSWIVFEGNEDLTGFISKSSLQTAKSMLI